MSGAILFVRASFWILLFRVAKQVLPPRRLIPFCCRPFQTRPLRRGDINQIVSVVDRAAKALDLGNGGPCLERSLTLARLLSRNGLRPEIVIGLRRTHEGLAGHAWVNLDGVLLGESGATDFVTVASFPPAAS
jgi:hypothetical protein